MDTAHPVCPSGLALEGCPEGRTGITSDACKTNRYASNDGRCLEYENGSVALQSFIALVLGLLFLCLFVTYTLKESKVSRQSNLTVICCASTVVTSIQVLNAMITILVKWIEPTAFCQPTTA